MHCHLCEKGAIGVCRHCYKFYCQEHGDQFCQGCKQKGWSAGENRPIAAPVATLVTANAKAATTDKENGKGEESKAEEKEPVAAAGST